MLILPLVALLLLDPPPETSGKTPERAASHATSHATSHAASLLEHLDDASRSRAHLRFDDPARRDWSFLPGRRQGLRLGDLGPRAREHLELLLADGLGASGYRKAVGVITLEAHLRDVERAAGGNGAGRDPDAYTIAVFGEPGDDPWGWRLEGHHLSINMTATDGVTAGTPLFFGANPAQIRSGPRAGQRLLAEEEDRAFELLHAFDDDDRATVVIEGRAPRDILMGPGVATFAHDPEGRRAADMADDQRAMLRQLVEIYLDDLAPSIATLHRDAIDTVGFDDVRFAWAGALERGDGHYYRIHGPTFVIEYDNVQNGANHVHAAFHDLRLNFGDDLLRRHHAGHE